MLRSWLPLRQAARVCSMRSYLGSSTQHSCTAIAWRASKLADIIMCRHVHCYSTMLTRHSTCFSEQDEARDKGTVASE